MNQTVTPTNDFFFALSSYAMIDPPVIPLPDDPGPDIPAAPTPPPQIDDPEPPTINDPMPPETDWLA